MERMNQRCTPKKEGETPLLFDYIEIGTSDFRTLSQSQGKGISVEPVKVYYDNLIITEGSYKLNVAISDHIGKCTVYWVNPDKIANEPDWVRGCNSINKPHPTMLKKYPHLVEAKEVGVITMAVLFGL